MQLSLYHVVDDVPAAVERWVATYGAGPFFVVEEFRLDEQYCLGGRVEYSETLPSGRGDSPCSNSSISVFATLAPSSRGLE